VDGFYRRAYELLTLHYGDEAPRRRSFDDPAPLPANPLARPDEAGLQRHRIVFGGGMMGAMPSQREHRGLFWTVNGKPVHEELHAHAPILTLRRGASYALELVNDTSWHHPIHLHGHVFRVASVNGKPAAPAHWADTVLSSSTRRAG
jgi:FtsP/CotA-like multicopper oxidase with cupredoxin domain